MKIRSAYAAKLSPANLNSLTHFPQFWHAFRRVPLACIMHSSHFPRSHPSVSPLRNDGKTSHNFGTHFAEFPLPAQCARLTFHARIPAFPLSVMMAKLHTTLARISTGSV